MDEAEILALETKFGAVKTAQLLDDRKKMASAKEKGMKGQPQVKADVVNDIARLYKVNRKEDPERYHALAGNVQDLNDALRVKLGREPTAEELLAAAKKMQAEDELKIKDGWLWDDKEAALRMTAAEKQAAQYWKNKEAGK